VVNWNFVTILLLGWTALVLSLIWLMRTWEAGGLWGVLAIVLLVPLAMMWNRNR
jgi:hypothetical protein